MQHYATAWIVTVLIILGVLAILGISIKKGPFGVFIDSNNRVSLSRFQLVVWTLLLISAYFAVAIGESTMNITMDNNLLALLGISVGSSASAFIIKGTKSAQQPDTNRVTLTSFQLQNRVGIIATSPKPSIIQMFNGDELTNQDYIDIGKVQMFFFTLAAVIGYALVLWHFKFDPKNGVYAFPTLSESIVWLLGISHTGYLTIKAAPKLPVS